MVQTAFAFLFFLPQGPSLVANSGALVVFLLPVMGLIVAQASHIGAELMRPARIIVTS